MKRTRFRFRQISKWTITVLCLLLLFRTYSQQTRIPLKAVLDSLESTYGVIFSYADENIISKDVDFPDPNLSLDRSLELLSQSTGLVFEKLSDRYIAIRQDVSYEVCGYLLDKKNRDPIIAAIIGIQGSDIYGISDDEGFFQLQIKSPKAALNISHVSYTEETISVSSTEACVTILLLPSISQLQEVYVSNYLVKGLDKKMYGELEVRTKELQVLPGLSEPDVLYTMQLMPGVQSPLESVSNINIRGGTNDQNLILWDGIRMFQSSHFYGLISAFNPYFTESVSLIKNGSSASLGESVSGVLDIHASEDVSAQLSGGGGANLISADAYLNVPVSEKASVSFSARRSIADLVETPTYKNYFERAFSNSSISQTNASDINSDRSFVFYDLSGKLNYQPTEKDRVHLSFIHISNDLEYQQEIAVDSTFEAKESELTQRNTGASLKHSRTWGAGIKTNFTSYVSSYGLAALNNDLVNNQRLIQENEVLDVGIGIDVSVDLGSNLDLTSGIQYEETGITNLEDLSNPEFRRRIKEVMTRYIGYSELGYSSLSGRTHLRFGVRANYFDQINRFIPEPRFAFNQEIVSNISVEVMGEFKSQGTMQIIDLQTDFLGVEKRRWVLSNDVDIPLIQSKQVSVGLQFLKDNTLISAEGYFKEVDGIITSSQGFQNQFELVRTMGNYLVYGADFLLSKQIDQFSIWLSYAWAKNNYEFPDLSMRSFPNKLDIRHNISVGTSYASDHFQLSTGINAYSGLPYTDPDPTDPIVDGAINFAYPNGNRLDPYLRVDFSAKYLFNLGEEVNAQIGFSFWNLTNQENILRRFYRLDNSENVLSVVQRGLYFTPNIMFRISF